MIVDCEWKDGQWTIEFTRKLDTGHNDDVLFKTTGKYQFGISRYEVAGREPEKNASQPLYGCGDVGEKLNLIFNPSKSPKKIEKQD